VRERRIGIRLCDGLADDRNRLRRGVELGELFRLRQHPD